MAKAHVTRTEFLQATACAFDGVAAAAVDLALETAQCMVNLERWGERASLAHTYLSAHFLAEATGVARGDQLKRKRIDKLELEFQNAASSSDLGSTKWGRQYLALRSGLFSPPIVGRLC